VRRWRWLYLFLAFPLWVIFHANYAKGSEPMPLLLAAVYVAVVLVLIGVIRFGLRVKHRLGHKKTSPRILGDTSENQWCAVALEEQRRLTARDDGPVQMNGSQPFSGVQSPVTTPTVSEDRNNKIAAGAHPTDDEIYESIAMELEQGSFSQGLWTRIFAETNGDPVTTKVNYIKERAITLMETRRSAIEAEQKRVAASEEQRRVEARNANKIARRDAERAIAWGCSTEEAAQSYMFGIAREQSDGDGSYTYIYKQIDGQTFRYDKLIDAMNYAKRQLP
jgi:hypothetical protein